MTQVIAYANPAKAKVTMVLWQIATFTLLIVGYAGFYLCRSHLSVVAPLLKAEFTQRFPKLGDPTIVLGDIISLGLAFYVVGKFVGGMTGDFIGGRNNFLGGMGGAIFFTVMFAVSGTVPLLTLWWVGNRFIQAFGWPGMIKVAGKWAPYSYYGVLIGTLSLSYLFGDSAARLFMGLLISRGFGWREVFFVDAIILAFWFVLTFLFLRESPAKVGLPELPPDPATVASDESEEPHARLFGRLFISPEFWLICLVSLATYGVREVFNDWTTVYFVDVLKMSKGAAASNGAWFPLIGGISVILFGLASDLLGRSGRAVCMIGGFSLSGIALFMLAGATHPVVGVVLVIVVGFVLIGPYSFLGGSMALDFGGRSGASTATGIIDGVGYIGGIFAGSVASRISVAYGWGAVFKVLGVATFAAAGVSVAYYFVQGWQLSKKTGPRGFAVVQPTLAGDERPVLLCPRCHRPQPNGFGPNLCPDCELTVA